MAAMSNLAQLLLQRGSYDEAEPLAQEAAEASRRNATPDLKPHGRQI